MCLAVPGQIIAIDRTNPLMPEATVSYGGVRRPINLSYVPEAKVGDYVVAHVGIGIALIDESKALETIAAITALGEAVNAN